MIALILTFAVIACLALYALDDDPLWLFPGLTCAFALLVVAAFGL